MASLGPGSAVPPERELAVEFTTSRTTVRQALTELVVEGRLERIQGRGTFVAKPKVAQILQLTSYTQDMQAQGLAPDVAAAGASARSPPTRTWPPGWTSARAPACSGWSGSGWPTRSRWRSR